ISRPSQDWLLNHQEPQTCLDAYWPSVPVTLNSVDPGGGQTLVVTPGQFRCTSGSAATVTGIQRNYSSLTVELLHSNPADTEPPTVNEISMSPGGGTSLNVTVRANDPSGIARIVLMKVRCGAFTALKLNIPLNLTHSEVFIQCERMSRYSYSYSYVTCYIYQTTNKNIVI